MNKNIILSKKREINPLANHRECCEDTDKTLWYLNKYKELEGEDQ